PLGRPLAELYGDTVLDVDVKPNRGDALCLVGLAREVSAINGAPVRFPPTQIVEGRDRAADRVVVDVMESELCTRFVARFISGVSVGTSPDDVQMRLLAAGMRPISNVVDASNYVMLELGKPTHAYDAARVRGAGSSPDLPRIVVRRANAGEMLETLDHVRRELESETLVIADPSGVIGIAGIMGGAETEVSDDTRDVIVESAIFDPLSIRRTGHRYALRSEASLRFEKGQEFRLARIGADRVTSLIASWAGGTVAAGAVDTAPEEPEPATVAFRPSRVNRLLGTALSAEEQAGLLARVGIEASASGDQANGIVVSAGAKPLIVGRGAEPVLVARIPTWRGDLVIEADVAEEIARVGGYEEIPATLPDTEPPGYRPDPLEARDAVREVLAGAGLREVVTYALIAPDVAARLRWPGDAGQPAVGEAPASGGPITVTNPLSANHSVLRQQLVSNLIGIVDQNVRQGRDDVAVFEVGKGYGRTGNGPHEWSRLAFALTGAAEPATWNRERREYDLDDAKGLVELLAAELGHESVAFEAYSSGYPFHPGRTAVARSGASLIGYVGELHPAAIETFDVRVPRLLVAELSIAGLSGGQLPAVRSRPVPRHPAVERDIAVVVAEGRPAREVADLISQAAGLLLSDLRLFDIYRGAPLAAHEKSLAYRLTFQADRTLTDADIDEAIAAVTGVLAASGARLRA
ncbi:MAG TPA: phenylalanine--tRNA ligase subunit beta, partial [Candidatus Acidoferrum sp.]|nr:phenylalanine--tRNA ligase subunit beta [Candidatus Acidoferrum sp.]